MRLLEMWRTMADLTSLDVTIADIAQAAGVSTATVSRVPNDHPYVAEETRLRVQRLIEQTGYQNKLAQKHRAETPTNAITVIASLADNEYINAILWGIQDQLDLGDYHVMLRLWGADPASEVKCARLAHHNGSKGLTTSLPLLRGSRP
jgi:DNA-binding LacI/PurR family transcriptional regulator